MSVLPSWGETDSLKKTANNVPGEGQAENGAACAAVRAAAAVREAAAAHAAAAAGNLSVGRKKPAAKQAEEKGLRGPHRELQTASVTPMSVQSTQ